MEQKTNEEKNSGGGNAPAIQIVEVGSEKQQADEELEAAFSGFSDAMFEDEVSQAAEAAFSAVRQAEEKKTDADTKAAGEQSDGIKTVSGREAAGKEASGSGEKEVADLAAEQIAMMLAEADAEQEKEAQKAGKKKRNILSGFFRNAAESEERSGAADDAGEEEVYEDEDNDDGDWDDEEESGEYSSLLQKPILTLRNVSIPELTQRQKKQLQLMLLVVGVLVVCAIAAFSMTRWVYKDYEVIRTRKQEDTLAATYCRAGKNILRYGMDGATLTNIEGDVLWDADYSMKDPEAVVCSGKILLYDRNGTAIIVCGEKGKEGTITTNYPITRAKLTAQGLVVALMENSDSAYIEYYKPEEKKGGKTIATIKSSMENPGYPLDFAVSPNGQMIAVSYLAYDDGGQKDVVCFYNFGSTGQNQTDNLVSAYEYEDTIIPRLEYVSDMTCAAIGDNAFVFYKGTSTMNELLHENIDAEIRSVICDEQEIGLITGNDSGNGYRIHLYDTSTGKKKTLEKKIDFDFDEAEIVGDEISLYNGASIYMLTTSGNLKFNGSYHGNANSIFSLGNNRYIVVGDNSLEEVELK